MKLLRDHIHNLELEKKLKELRIDKTYQICPDCNGRGHSGKNELMGVTIHYCKTCLTEGVIKHII